MLFIMNLENMSGKDSGKKVTPLYSTYGTNPKSSAQLCFHHQV
jgi:hypothetical protein